MKLATLLGIICLAPQIALAQTPAAATYTLTLVSYVNNGNPGGISPTAQSVIGTFSTQSQCMDAGRTSLAIGPAKDIITPGDPLRVYFVCVQSK